jgi:hypothetical protein
LFIKSNIQNEIKENPSKYPLANELVKLHDISSKYGSHADINSFSDRIEVKETTDTNVHLAFHYFQHQKSEEETIFYLLQILKTFLSIFKIYKIIFDKRLIIVDPQWENNIKDLGVKLDESINKYKSFVTKK